jgi:hypothetical protein
MSRQDQNVEAGGTALQAGRDVVVHHGISAEQMSEIMVAMAKQLSAFQSEALEKANARIDDFQQEVLKRFAQPGKANPDAFRDPDFQYLLGDAQEAVARSGDDAVRDTLVDIIARRSMETTRNRLAITLNEAATKAANLTANEFSTLSLTYLLRYTIDHSVISFPSFCVYVEKRLMPFVKGVSREQSSFWHLQAQACGNIEMGEISLVDIFRQTYGGVFGKGFTRQQLQAHLPEGKKDVLNNVIAPCINDESKLQPVALNFNKFKEISGGRGLNEAELKNVWSLFENTIPDLKGWITSALPISAELFDVWENTQLKHFSLTSVGIAIGHANATRIVDFNAPLNIWIK